MFLLSCFVAKGSLVMRCMIGAIIVKGKNERSVAVMRSH